jgi:hypothetical protein
MGVAEAGIIVAAKAAVTGPMLGTERSRSTRGCWTARCSIVASGA